MSSVSVSVDLTFATGSSLSREYPKDFDFVFVSLSEPDGRKIADELQVKASEAPVLLIQNFVVAGARSESFV